MNTNTTTAATAAVQTAINNQTAAIAKARQAAMDSQAAASHAAELDRRLRAGDATVDIEAMVDAKASAERLALLAGAYHDQLPSFEPVIREARTAETVAKLQAGAIRTREQIGEFVDAMAAKLADELESLVPELESERLAMVAIGEALPETTAYGNGFQYRNGSPYSPIRVASGGDSYGVDGSMYSTGVDVDHVLNRIVSEVSTVLIARKSTRDLPALMAGRAERAAQSREQMEIDREHREVSSLRRS